MVGEDLKLSVRDLSISYGDQLALSGVSLDVREHEIFGIIGPAGSGKTSFLRTLNRMEILQENMTVEGSIVFGGRNISEVKNVGLPLSVYDNVALAPRLSGIKEKGALDEIVERCLTRAALWDEVKDRLTALGSMLSGGQQQRLTIARALSQKAYCPVR